MRIDIEQWVEKDPDSLIFRRAVHTVLYAISTKRPLQSTMVMKGGILLALSYNSQRHTIDVDFSSPMTLTDFDQKSFKNDLNDGLMRAVEHLGYGLDCRIQRIERRPPSYHASFPTIRTNIGYAYKHEINQHRRLMRGNASRVIKIDYSLNEQVSNVEFLEIGEGNTIRIYNHIELIAEKLRAILQQKARNRIRGQDLYDLYNILDIKSIEHDENTKFDILKRLIEKSRARGLHISIESISDPEVITRSREGYKNLPNLVDDELLDFETIYGEVERFYKSLPWEDIS